MTSLFKPFRLQAGSLLFLLSLPVYSSAQQRPELQDSKTLLEKGIRLHDQGKFSEAIVYYRQVPPGDTNYALALYEESLSCLSDSNFTGARDAALKGLEYPLSEGRRTFLLTLGHAYDYLGRSDSARYCYDSLVKLNPYDHQPVYETGVTWFHAKEYDKAIACLRRSLMLNPYHFRSHFILGNCYLMQGRLTEAWLALSSSLFFTNDAAVGKATILVMADIANQTDEVANAYKAKSEVNSNAFDDIDAIIHAKLALSRDYKFKSDLAGDRIVNVTHMIMEKLKFDASDTNFTMQLYVPLYTALYRDDLFDPSILLMFTGNEIGFIDKMARKNKRDVKEAKEVIYPYFDKVAATQVVNYEKRRTVPEKILLIPAEQTLFVATVKSKNPLVFAAGPLTRYENGNLSSYGAVNSSGEQEGSWDFYYANGKVRLTERYRNGKLHGETVSYYKNGNVRSRQEYKDGEQTKQSDYDNNGRLNSVVEIKGRTAAATSSYHWNGTKEYTVEIEDGRTKDGHYPTYYDNGTLRSEADILKGERSGVYKEYHRNGKVSEEGNYRNGKKDGEYKYYYDNGRLSLRMSYSNDKPDGVHEQYDREGRLTEKGTYRNGKKEGPEYYFDPEDGFEYGRLMYRDDILVGAKYTDKSGKVLSEQNSESGLAKAAFYNAAGVKMSELSFHKGKVDGLAQYFYPDGSVRNNANYTADHREGESAEFYRNGKKKSERSYKEDAEHGLYTYYNENGQRLSEGHLVNGNKQGIWDNYRADGSLQRRTYYNKNKENGPEVVYFRNGSTNYIDWYDAGVLIGMTQFDTSGREIARNWYPGGNGQYRLLYPDGKLLFESELKNGVYEGPFRKLYPDGQLMESGYFRNGHRDSTLITYGVTGKPESKGSYRNGELHGDWVYYDEAGYVREESRYEYGQQQGREKLYNGNILRFEYQYKDGELDGEQIYYGEDKKVAAVLIYREGELTGYTYEGKDGKRVPVIPVKNGTAEVTTYYSNGSNGVALRFVNNLREGKQLYYYSNGKPSEERTYEKGRREGMVKRWYPDGKPLLECSYRDGEQIGREVLYTTDGTVACSLNYTQGGYLHGNCSYTDPAAKKTKTILYYYGAILSVQ